MRPTRYRKTQLICPDLAILHPPLAPPACTLQESPAWVRSWDLQRCSAEQHKSFASTRQACLNLCSAVRNAADRAYTGHIQKMRMTCATWGRTIYCKQGVTSPHEVQSTGDVSAVIHQPQHHAPAEKHVVHKHHIVRVPGNSTRSRRPAAVTVTCGPAAAACVAAVQWC
jgi:hypothetical protein